MRLPLHIVITTHSQFGREQNVLLFYSLFIIEFTYCMYIIVNKATFMVNDTIMAIIKNNIKLINTTSLSDSKLSGKVATQLLISFSMIYSIQYFLLNNKRTYQNFTNNFNTF